MTTNSIAKGAELNAETWADFVARLHHDCVGAGVDRHYTADAIFIVEARHMIFGIDPDYTDHLAVIIEDQYWISPREYWDNCEPEERGLLDATATEESDGECNFLDLREADQWDLLRNLPDHTVTGWDDRWEYVCANLTRDAADAFVARKKHDYPAGLRVNVEAQIYCWEFNAIKQAILSGRIVFQPPKGGGGK